MLYGIGVVVIAAFIFLIVYNVKAAKSLKPRAPAKQTDRQEETGPDKGVSEAAPEPNKLTASSDVNGSRAANGPEVQTEPSTPLSPPAETGHSQSTSVSALHRQQSDDEYRDALRRFSAKSASADAPKENKDESPKQSKDEAYREGLRSLTKRD